MYKAGVPVNLPLTDENSYYTNFEAEFHNFWTNGSYYCILAGMGCLTTRCRRSPTSRSRSKRPSRCSTT